METTHLYSVPCCIRFALPGVGDAIKLKNSYTYFTSTPTKKETSTFKEDYAFYLAISTIQLIAIGLFTLTTGCTPIPFIAYAVVKLGIAAIHTAGYFYKSTPTQAASAPDA